MSANIKTARPPAPFIQNYSNWCWVVAVKLLVFQHISPKPCLEDHLNTVQELVVAPQNFLSGLRTEYAGHQNGRITIDKWQYEIATQINPEDINTPANDSQKIQAIEWLLSRFSPSSSTFAKSLGYYLNSALWDNLSHVLPILESGRYIIGNAVLQPYDKSHNFILTKHSNGIILYDPWDGFQTYLSIQQAFQSGFLCNTGQGVIRWVQYIE